MNNRSQAVSRLAGFVVLLSFCVLPFQLVAQTVTLAGVPGINTVAGTPQTSGYTGDGGPAGLATLNWIYGIAVDASGNYYIADAGNNVIRVVNRQNTAITIAGIQIQPGNIASVAGNGTSGYSGDSGPATSAELDYPYAVAVDKTGNLFIADTDNDVIRKVTTDGTITTFAGTGVNEGCWGGYSGDGGPATEAQISCPLGIAVDGTGNVYIADTYNNVIRMVNTDGIINTVAGNGTDSGYGCEDNGSYTGDGGPATGATLNCPVGVAVDAAGNFYISDYQNSALRAVNTQNSAITIAGVQIQPGNINTVAGDGTAGYSGDGGPATLAELSYPWSSSVDSQGNIFIADGDNYVIREVNSQGTISTFAGNGSYGFSGDGGPANQASFAWAPGVAVNGSGNVFIVDEGSYVIRMTTPGGGISQDFGQVTLGNNTRQFVQLQFNAPITISSVQTGGDFSIQPICGDCNSAHPQSSGPDLSKMHLPQRIAKHLKSHRFAGVHQQSQLQECTGTFTQGQTCEVHIQFAPTLPGFRSAPFILTDNNSVEYSIGFTGTGMGSTLAFTPGMIGNIAGNATAGYSGDGGAATSAELAEPLGIVRDGAGNLFIADGQNNVVRKVDTNGNISTVVGNGTGGYSGDGGLATSAELRFPFGLSMDSAGNLYIADIGNNVIRKVDVNGIITTFAGTGTFGYSGDGVSALAAELANPVGVLADNLGNVYIADTFNNVIRKVNRYGTITTVAGNGYGAGTSSWQDFSGTGGYTGDGGPATQAELFIPFNIGLDLAGNLYIADSENSVIREVNNSGTISTVAGICPEGTCAPGYSGDGGPAVSAQLAFPVGVGFDSAGEMFIADSYNSSIRKVDVLGNIWTVAGEGQTPNVKKNNSQVVKPVASNAMQLFNKGKQGLVSTPSAPTLGGVATQTQIAVPASVVLDNAGNFYAADAEFNVVWKVDVTTSLLAFGDQLVGGSTDPMSVTVVNAGNVGMNLNQLSVAAGFTDVSSGDTVCSTVIPMSVGANCVVSMTFSPTESGSYNGSLTVSDDAFNTPQSAALTGTGFVTAPVDTALGYVKAPPSTVRVGGAVGVIKVGVYDSNSNLDTSSSASITVTITGPNSFSSAQTQPAVAGVATLDFSQVVLPTVGQYSVSATSGSLTPANVAVSATAAPDYSITADPGSLTLKAGSSGLVTLTISPVGGYTGTVNFACSGLPSYSTCTFQPASASLDGSNTPVTVKLTVDTSSANHVARLEAPMPMHGSPAVPAGLWFVQTGLAGLVLAGSAKGRHNRSRQLWIRACVLIVFVAAMLLVTGCGGNSHGAPVSPTNPTTPAGTYTSTVTASASGGSGSHHAVNVKITIVE